MDRRDGAEARHRAGTAAVVVDTIRTGPLAERARRTIGAELGESWRVLCAAFAMTCCTWFPLATYSLFIDPIRRETGWTASAVGAWATMLFVGCMMAAPIAGKVADLKGSRGLILVTLPLFALVIGSVALVGESIWLFYAVGLLAGLCSAAIINGTGPSIRAVVASFSSNPGTAIGIVATGSSIAAALGPSAAQQIIDSYGWRAGFGALALIILACYPLLIIWLREPLPARGDETVRSSRRGASPGSLRIFGEPIFWLLAAACLLSYCAIYGSLVFMVPALTSFGLDRSTAALCLGSFGITSVVGKLLAGFLSDRVHAPLIMAVAFLSQGLALGALSFVGTDKALMLCLVAGLSFGAETATVNYCVLRYFGMRSFAYVVGFVTLFGGLGSAAGPYMFGAIQDWTTSFTSSFMVAGMLEVAAAALFLVISFFSYRYDD